MEKRNESRYGPNKENVVLDKSQTIGTAIVTFDLLKIKHSNAIDFDKLMSATPNVKGATFILYNFARLQTLLASFEQQVQSGFYAPLPEFDQIDFSLLKEEVCAVLFIFLASFRFLVLFCFDSFMLSVVFVARVFLLLISFLVKSYFFCKCIPFI